MFQFPQILIEILMQAFLKVYFNIFLVKEIFHFVENRDYLFLPFKQSSDESVGNDGGNKIHTYVDYF